MNPAILIIDDDAIVRTALRRTMAAHGFEAIFAESGAAALDLVRTLAPPLVLTDIIMPDKDGIEIILELRRIRPDIKIIAMSGGGRLRHSDLLQMARNLGANAIIAKPFEPDEIMALVREQLTGA